MELHNVTLSFQECFDAIKNDGNTVTHMIEGEPGIGKTRLGSELANSLIYEADGKPYNFVYLDIANMSLGDLMYPVPDRARKCMEFYPNEVFKLHEDRPAVIMMDEWTKGSKEVKNMTLPLALERRIGSEHLHPDSIVFATGNMTRDGVGDSIQAHQRNRFIAVHMRKPTAEEWIGNYALNNNVDPTVIAFADQFPHAFQSYTDDPSGDNAYIFNPKKPLTSYTSPRSLEFASNIIKTRANKSELATMAQLVGAIGPAAAADLMNFVRMNEELPPFASIVADPEHCMLPTQPTNRLLLTFSLIVRADKDNIRPLIQYMKRMNNEMQALFANKLLSTTSKATWVAQVPEIGQFVIKLHHIF